MKNTKRGEIEQAINADETRFDYGTDLNIVSTYKPSGLYEWLTLSDGRSATYYPMCGRVVCHTPMPYAIDTHLPQAVCS